MSLDQKHDVEATVCALPNAGSPSQEESGYVTPEHDAGKGDSCEFLYPEGGWEAWQQVAAGFIAQAMTWGYPTTFGIYQLYYTSALNLPNAQVSWIGSVQTFCTYAMCVVSGRLADAGYHRSTVLAGSILAVLGAFMTSVATEFWQILLAQGFCQGIGLGVFFMPTVTVVSSYFCKRRALAICICATGPAVGSVIFPAIVQYLIPQIGFPWASRCAAFVMLGFLVVLNLMFKPRAVHGATIDSGPWIDWSAFKDRPYVLFTLASFILNLGLFVVTSYINTYAKDILGFDSQRALGLLLILNGASGPPRLIVGIIADRWCGPINSLICCVTAMGILVYAWIAVTAPAPMYIYAVLFGAVFGPVTAVFAGALTTLTKDPAKAGVRFGMNCTLISFATLAGAPIAGSIIDSRGNYLGAQVYSGTIVIAAAVVFVCCRVAITGFNLRVKV